MLTWLVVCGGSIREFCDLQMPILMFDKDGNYCVLKLEEVSVHRTARTMVFGLWCADSAASCSPCLSAPSIWIAQEILRSIRELRCHESSGRLRLVSSRISIGSWAVAAYHFTLLNSKAFP